MDQAMRRHENVPGDRESDAKWASEDISVLAALLETPTRRGSDESGHRGSPSLSWASCSSHDDEEDDHNADATPRASTHHAAVVATDDVVVTALKRQVQLLQQEYDRHLEQRVARSVVAAGGRSAPRAATIKLYRQYERLARVAKSLEAENRRLAALLAERQQLDHTRDTERDAARPSGGHDHDHERIPRRKRGMLDADAKPSASMQRAHDREEMPGSSGEEK